MLVVIGNYKGGVGKSMAAVNLAAMRAGRGYEVKLIDTDIQESAYGWAGIRNENPMLAAIVRGKATGAIWSELMAERAKWDTVIVDAGGQDSAELRLAIAACDVLLVPVKPAMWDEWAMARMSFAINSARQEGRKFRALSFVSAADTRTKEGAETRARLAERYVDLMPPIDVIVGERIAYRNALRAGMGLADGTEDTRALSEFSQVYDAVFGGEQ